ncbi:hypothetical protein I302_109062 [Kwoniella bestiolae CBS 10118]|uniref:Coiled-coil domain-containing protein 130 n=1 Tax=Kwoniella bestiolae CBS 10118 TaxID=1296100 RepID=A0A1B9FUV7_9TREE|nr:coiled-coil domain-containing protein 130 [Kwoniella bestiolae CBS 10118]OCF22556.1 coiled-coil domain-containing protein 130 [Kwoniella bestiolae CBS 10118]
MQGLNRYIPPDYDPRKTSTLNKHQGKKHALGVRAKDIDKGILVVRFELPFNIWCGTCNAHIGAGVRYNARKQKVGNYFSTPVYGFRCKCHLCDGWFEIRTDPKNAAYVVHEGARKKDEDWDPEENGGFAVHDTEAPSASEPPADPFAGVEKTIDQQTWAKRGTSRLTELTKSSDRINSDPYRISSALRRKFREEKKVLLERQLKDDGIKEKYGLNEDLIHLQDGNEDGEKDRKIWEIIRENRGASIPSGSSSMSTPRNQRKGRASDTPSLVEVLRKNTGKKYDPFAEVSFSSSSTSGTPVKLSPGGILGSIKGKGKIKGNVLDDLSPKPKVEDGLAETNNGSTGLAGGLLAGYGSD